MGRIQSSIGLITGVPILETVDQLMALAARPRDLIAARNKQLQAEQVAVTELTSLVLAVQLATDRLADVATFQHKEVSSEDSDLISAARTGSPVSGSYRVVPVRQAQAQQLLTAGFASLDEPLGEGTLSFRSGGAVDKPVLLEELNGGQGVRRGLIRITDRSGASAVIDLSFARTVDDVVEAINNNITINVTAATVGDAWRLADNTGQAVNNLIVQDVGRGNTAADLGLAGINVASSTATGQDVLRLHGDIRLSRLNDGTGVSFLDGLPDLLVRFRDGSTSLAIDFGLIGQGPQFATATTVAANGVNAQITFTAVERGRKFDGVTIQFVHDPSVTQGDETVTYDESDPANKTLTFRIAASQTTANDVIEALENDPDASDVVTASAATGGNGTGLIDLSDTAVTSGGAAIQGNLDTLLSIFNAADPTRLSAAISADGDHLELTDLTTGSDTFSVGSLFGGTTPEDLGLTGAAVGGVLTSRRLQAGLKTTLLSSLNGGSGLGTLGSIQITDRSGTSASVDLSAALTLDDVLAAINAAPVGVVASVNAARNGILLTDTTASTASNLIVANVDATNTADKLGITLDDAQTFVDGGSLRLPTISQPTRLDSLRGGEGVFSGTFVIKDSNLAIGVVKLNQPGAEITTVGGVIDAINALTIGVEARINDAGDGILLMDTAGGTQTMEVKDLAGGSTAADLKLAGTATLVDIGGTPTQVIDGTYALQLEIDADDTLSDLVTKINNLDADLRASVLNDGSSLAPFHLSLANENTGSAREIYVDTREASFTFQEVARAQDALLLFGSAENPAAGVLAASPTNTFEEILAGVSLTVEGTSTSPVTVTVENSDTALVDAAQEFIDAVNQIRERIGELTFFNDVDNSTGVLFGSSEVLRVETELDAMFTNRFFGVGRFQSLAALGISIEGVNEDSRGRVALDTEKLSNAFAADSDSVAEFFTEETSGVAHKLNALIESLAGADTSLLVSRSKSLGDKIATNQARIDTLNVRLERERQRLLEEFFRVEETVARLQANLSAIQAIQVLPALV